MKKDNKSLLFERMQYLNPDFKKPLKEGVEEVKVVNEDDKWIQKAVNPEHKGFCTPMTKDTCTPERKALAKRFKKGIEGEGVEDMGAEMGGEEPKEKTPEEKLQELTAKVDELYALLHGEEEGEEEEAPEMGAEKSSAPEGLTEWNFDKKKGEKKEVKKEDGKKKYNFEKKEGEESAEHEASETPAEEKKEHEEKKELGEVKANAGKKVPVAAIAKVGK